MALVSENERLNAEIKRLRKALKDISQLSKSHIRMPCSNYDQGVFIGKKLAAEIANRALT